MTNVDDFDVARIVPSMRDLPAALGTRRRALALIPVLEPDDDDASLSDIARLDETVRAFATTATGTHLRTRARAAGDVPLLALAPCERAVDCQRSRYFGADGVCVEPTGDPAWEALLLVARSMRMMPLLLVPTVADTDALAASPARAFVLRGNVEHVLRTSMAFPKTAVVVVDWSTRAPAFADLRALAGHVDAVLVAASVHRDEGFGALASELDP